MRRRRFVSFPLIPPVSSVFTPKPKYPFLNLGLKLAPIEVKAKSGMMQCRRNRQCKARGGPGICRGFAVPLWMGRRRFRSQTTTGLRPGRFHGIGKNDRRSRPSKSGRRCRVGGEPRRRPHEGGLTSNCQGSRSKKGEDRTPRMTITARSSIRVKAREGISWCDFQAEELPAGVMGDGDGKNSG